MLTLRLSVLIWWLLPSFLSFGQVDLQSSNFPITNFGKSVEYAISPEQTIEQALDLPFVESGVDNLNLGFQEEDQWVRFVLRNQSDGSDFILFLSNPFIDTLSLYEAGSSNQTPTLLYKTGELLANNSKPIKNLGFAFPLKINPGDTKTYYLKSETKTTSYLDLELHTPASFVTTQGNYHILMGLVFGVLAFACLYNLFLGVGLKDAKYLYFAVFVLANGLLYFQIEGYIKFYLISQASELPNRLVAFFIGFCNVSSIAFVYSFLGINRRHPIARPTLVMFILASLFTLLALFAPGQFINKVNQILVLFTAVYMIYVGVATVREGNRSGFYLILGFTFYIIGSVAIVLRNLGKIEYNTITSHMLEFGMLTQVIFLAFALVDHYRRNQIEKEEFHNNLLELQQDYGKKLRMQVEERTQKLSSTVEALKQLSEETLAQRDSLERQNKVISETSAKVKSSLNYAQRIQSAVLPDEQLLTQIFPRHSIFYRPKDHVSGDFYYAKKLGDWNIFAVMDCTGHGVPGALMSVIGSGALEQAILAGREHRPDKILTEVNRLIKQSLHITEGSLKDGMEGSILSYNPLLGRLLVSSAKGKVWIKTTGKWEYLQPDKTSLGHLRREHQQNCFNLAEYDLNQFSRFEILLSTDGYVDQFGGNFGRKFGRKKLTTMLDAYTGTKPPAEYLEEAFDIWKDQAVEKQIDDVCLACLQVK